MLQESEREKRKKEWEVFVGEINSRRGSERKKKERSCNIPIFIPGQILNLT